jgi:hypothetical protein
VARGTLRLNGTELASGDGAALDAGRLEIEVIQDAELILWDLPATSQDPVLLERRQH